MKVVKFFQDMLKKKQYGYIALYSLFGLLVTTISVLLIGLIFMFLQKNIEILILVIGGYAFLYFLIIDFRNDKNKKTNRSLAEEIKNTEEQQLALAESNYDVVRDCLYTTLLDVSTSLNLVRPSRLSEIDSPNHFVIKNNFILYQFVVLKKTDVSISAVKEILQTRLTQKLKSLEFPGITQSVYIHNGQAFPILCINAVRDLGEYLELNIAWSNKAYCEYVTIADYNRLRDSTIKSLHDRDF